MSPLEILIGKVLPGVFIGTAKATTIILVVFWFDIALRGDLLSLYAGIPAFLLSSIGVGAYDFRTVRYPAAGAAGGVSVYGSSCFLAGGWAGTDT